MRRVEDGGTTKCIASGFSCDTFRGGDRREREERERERSWYKCIDKTSCELDFPPSPSSSLNLRSCVLRRYHPPRKEYLTPRSDGL